MSNQDYLIESPTRLSKSQLWDIQRNYFNHRGVSAWKNEIPFYISSNAFICARYAQLVANMILDMHDDKKQGPIYLVETGAGTGKFSFYFIKALLKALNDLDMGSVEFKYVLTDVALKNLNFCRENTSFDELVRSGHLDFAQLDCSRDKDFKLVLADKAFSEIQTDYPVIYICNYVFDCIEQDAFTFEGGSLQEVKVELKSRYQSFDREKPKNLRELKMYGTFHPMDTQTYYEDEKANRVLASYRDEFPNDQGYFLLPKGAFHFIDLCRSHGKEAIMIIGDKGIAQYDHLGNLDMKSIYTFDGCFAFSLNFDAIKRYVEWEGGDSLMTDNASSFKICLFHTQGSFEDMPQTVNYFNNEIESFGADEFCFMTDDFADNHSRYSLRGILSFLRMSHYDPDVYFHVHDRLAYDYPKMTPSMVSDLMIVLKKVEDNLYHYQTYNDVFSLLGRFYMELGNKEKAQSLFEEGLKHSNNTYFANLCLGDLYYERGNSGKAVEYYEKAIKQNPKDTFLKDKMHRIQGSPIPLIKPLLKTLFVLGACMGVLYFGILA